MRRTFANEFCEFSVVYGVVEFDDEEYVIGLKVATRPKYTSLGLRGNVYGKTPQKDRILTYNEGQWVNVPEERLVAENVDWGGIWCATSFGEANKIRRYFEEECQYGPAGVLAVLMDQPIVAKTGRVKCAGVMSLGEIDRKLDTPRKRHDAIMEMVEKFGGKIKD